MFTSTKNDATKKETKGSFTRQGSLRRVIPSTSSDNEHLFGRQNEDLNKIFKVYRQENIILTEYKMIQSEDIRGVYVIPSKGNPLLWFGVIFARNGPYKNGVFRFNLILDDNFPDSEHPKVIFQSKVLHPVINSETNELNLHGAFPTWHKNEQHIWQVLKYVQWIFCNIEATVSHGIDKEACEMFLNDREAFNAKALELVQQNQETLYELPQEEDMHYIVFEEFNPELHKKDKMIAYVQHKDENEKNGYSWVLPGIFKPLQRPSSPISVNETKGEST
ncbi:hypothetical protein ABEB36_003193 [Hypothenemus hampei]|uniref:UBC core domain-containing protein n=1 Tax=Hypothenemus hampei TaxID=57062 RepID=A0ABD1FB06_HYPHA